MTPFRRGFTLIEVLATVLIIALVAGLGGAALVRSLQADPLNEVDLILTEQLDAARRAARERHGLGVRLTRDGLRWDRGAETLRPLPDAVRCDWSWATTAAEDLQPESWMLDARGRGEDLVLICRGETGERRFRLSGLTGLLLTEAAR